MFGDNAVVRSSPALANEHTNSSVRDTPDWVFWVRLCLLIRSGMEKLTSCASAASVRLPAGVQTHADMPQIPSRTLLPFQRHNKLQESRWRLMRGRIRSTERGYCCHQARVCGIASICDQREADRHRTMKPASVSNAVLSLSFACVSSVCLLESNNTHTHTHTLLMILWLQSADFLRACITCQSRPPTSALAICSSKRSSGVLRLATRILFVFVVHVRSGLQNGCVNAFFRSLHRLSSNFSAAVDERSNP
ncbi:hypothetical protein QQF64_009355 [Cirrhinus molitorella]|uniref:Uncharacterized protein n=1 Tax=Cirrhinus molitorella TaxID=172907 RepID=A0ABR3M0Z7_9TELE